MTEIIIRWSEPNRVQININGETNDLVTILAAAIINDERFAILVMTSLAFIAQENSKFPDINPN